MIHARRLFCATSLALAGSMMLLAQEPPGPPAFVSFPILMHVTDNGLDHGHFVEGPGETAMPEVLSRTPAPGPDNPAARGGTSIASGGEYDASSASGSYEGETGAVSNGATLLGGSNHIYPGNCSTSAAPGAFGDCAPLAYASSSDGATFTSSSMSRVWNGTTFGIGFDPGIDVDKTGTFYYSYGVAPLSGSYPNAIVMMKSTNGTSWTPVTPITFNTNRFFDDKYYLAIDRSNNVTTTDRIYVSWDRNSGNNQLLYIAYSTNGGSTWTAPIKVNDGTSRFERVIGAYPAVDQNTGVVYDSWHDYARNIIFVDKSTNGGATWGTDRTAATTHAGFGADIGCVGGRSQGPAHALKVGPSGTLYLVYADPVKGRGFDVQLVTSTNGGTSWSGPVRLNDDGGAADQFHPTLSVESNGAGGDKVTVSFYDRRDDASNCLAHVYATQSVDNGATWSANIRLTNNASNFDGNPNGPGDYSSSTPHGTLTGPAVFPFFSQHLGGEYDVWTAVIR
jgi:hypothetical protein